MPIYNYLDRKKSRNLSLMDLDIIKHHGYYVPENTDLVKLDEKLSEFDICETMAWHLKALSEKHNKVRKTKAKYYLLAPHHVSHIAKLKNNMIKIYKTTLKKTSYYEHDLVCTIDNVLNIWEGMNTHPNFYRNNWDGNSLIIQDKIDNYIEFSNGEEYEYKLPEDETVQSYYGIISREYIISNCDKWKTRLDHFSTFSFGFTTKNRILFRGNIIDNSLVYPTTPLFSLLYKKYLEDNISKPKCSWKLKDGICFCKFNHSDGCDDECYDKHAKYEKRYIKSVSTRSLQIFGKSYVNNELDITMWNIIPIQNFGFYLPENMDRDWLAEHFKMINLDYIYRLCWDYQYMSNEELCKKQWRPKSSPDDIYQIMINCYSEYEFRVENGVINIYDKSEFIKEDGNELQVFSGKPCYTLENYEGYWLSENLSNVHYIGIEHGNHIIVKLTEPNQYLWIGHNITQFTLDTEIAACYSPIGNNGVPYSLIITKDNNVIDYMRYASTSLPLTPFFGDYLVNQIYGCTPNLYTNNCNKPIHTNNVL